MARAAAFSEDLAGQEKRIGFVTITNVDANFIQSAGSCVLSSYAIVGNYLRESPSASILKAIAIISAWLIPMRWMRAQVRQPFRHRMEKAQVHGYEVILDLHKNSKRNVLRSRAVSLMHDFTWNPPNTWRTGTGIEHPRDFLNITYEPGGDYHSITILNDGIHLMAATPTGKVSTHCLACENRQAQRWVLFVRK